MRQSYAAATERLARAGIKARPDGVEQYVNNRREWETRISQVAPALGYFTDDIDGRQPEKVA